MNLYYPDIALHVPTILVPREWAGEKRDRLIEIMREDYGVGCVVANPGLEELAGLLALARGYVGNDSGVSHLAAALGTPTVAVFGPTDPVAWGPRGESVAVLGGPGEGGFKAVDAMRVVAELERLMAERRG